MCNLHTPLFGTVIAICIYLYHNIDFSDVYVMI